MSRTTLTILISIACNALMIPTIIDSHELDDYPQADGQLDDYPQALCDVELAQQCSDDALQAQIVTGCNWYVIIPTLSACLDHALMGCERDEENDWQHIVSEFNTTLQSDWCNPSCTDQKVRSEELLECFTYGGGHLEHLILLIQSQYPPLESDCIDLFNMNDCLVTYTHGCPALTDLTYDRISHANGSAAFISCGLPPFQRLTTRAPVHTTPVTLPAVVPTTTPCAVTTASALSPDVGLIVIILVMGCIIILMTILLIILAATKGRRVLHENSLLRQWRPYGHKSYKRPSDDVTFIRSTTQAQNIFRSKHKYIEAKPKYIHANDFFIDPSQLA